MLISTAIPMLIIANAYRRLNLWNANCGASFEWVGRANSKWPNIAIAAGLVVVIAAISVIGIRIIARSQIAIGVIEYLILIVFAIWGLT